MVVTKLDITIEYSNKFSNFDSIETKRYIVPLSEKNKFFKDLRHMLREPLHMSKYEFDAAIYFILEFLNSSHDEIYSIHYKDAKDEDETAYNIGTIYIDYIYFEKEEINL